MTPFDRSDGRRKVCRAVSRQALILAFALFMAGADAAAGEVTGQATTRNGDDLLIAGMDLRLFGIDAFESGQRCEAGGRLYHCGRLAERALAEKIAGVRVTCQPRDLDLRRRRPVVECRIGDQNLNAWMVREGWALAYRRFALDYVDEEAAARLARRGAWRGAFVPPWQWRRGTRLPAEVAAEPAGAPPGCLVKGNLSPSGRVYHLPGQRYYEQTRIDPSAGERWFCTGAEAEAAGWRRSKR